MRKAVIGVLGLATAIALTSFALGGIAMAQTPTPSGDSGGAKTPWIGVTLVDLNERVAARLGISQTSGVAVVTVTADSPAEKGGTKAKDVVTAIDGKSTSTATEVTTAVKAKKAGDSLALTVLRDGKQVSLSIVVGERSQPTPKGQAGKANKNEQASPMSRFGGLLDGLKDLAPGEAFNHMLGSQWRFLDKDNKTVTIKSIPGTVISASKESLTIKPNDQAESGGPYAITSDTQVRLGGNAAVDSLKAGDQVVVTTADGKTALSVGAAAHNGLGGWMGGRGGPKENMRRGFDNRAHPTAPATPGSTS